MSRETLGVVIAVLGIVTVLYNIVTIADAIVTLVHTIRHKGYKYLGRGLALAAGLVLLAGLLGGLCAAVVLFGGEVGGFALAGGGLVILVSVLVYRVSRPQHHSPEKHCGDSRDRSNIT